MKLKKGDSVLIITGKDRGKKGIIIKVVPKRHRAVVDGLNLLKKHTKPTPRNPHGGIVEFAAPLDLSNLTLICPNCSKLTRVAKKITSDGSIRICKKCQSAIDASRTKKRTK